MISSKPVMMDPVEEIFWTSRHHTRCYIKVITGPHFSNMLQNMYKVMTTVNGWGDPLLLMKCLYKHHVPFNASGVKTGGITWRLILPFFFNPNCSNSF